MSEAFERPALGATLLNSATWPQVAVLGGFGPDESDPLARAVRRLSVACGEAQEPRK